MWKTKQPLVFHLLGTGAFRAVVLIHRVRGDYIDYLHSFCISKIPLIQTVEGDFAPDSLVRPRRTVLAEFLSLR